MTSNELMNLDPEDVARMTESELRDVVQQLASAANKRLKRLSQSETGRMSPAYQKAMERSYTTSRGGKFGTEGKNLNKLRKEYQAVRNFLGLKTSGLSGWNKVQRATEKRLGVKRGEVSPQGWSDFWKAYRELEKTNPGGVQAYGSEEAQRLLHREMGKSSGWEEAMKRTNDILTGAYEESEMDDVEELDDDDYLDME